jgi:hypothetical protein
LYYSIVEQKDNESFSAFELLMKLRSHKNSSSTQIYIRERNSIIIELFDRGEFGFLYDRILDEISENKKVSFKERTTEIKNLRTLFNSIQIEQFGDFLNQISRQEDQVFLNTILNLFNEEDFFEINRRMYIGEMPSKNKDVQCMVYPECIRKSSYYSCNTCLFAVHNVYSLIKIFEELCVSLEIFEQNTKNGVKKREALIINKLLKLLVYAVNKHGEEYVFSFCNDDSLIERLENNSYVIDKYLTNEETLI